MAVRIDNPRTWVEPARGTLVRSTHPPAGRRQQELVERPGAYRETVSQLIGRFRAARLIMVEPRRITRTVPDGLRAYAES